MIGVAGTPAVPNLYPYPAIYSDNTTTAGYTSTSAALSGGEKTLVIFAAGQSRMTNFPGTTTYTPTNATKVQQINPYNGTVYQAKDPMIGMGGSAGCYLTRMADTLITNGIAARVILIPLAVSGTSTATWVTPAYLARIETCCRWARSYGYAAPTADLYPCIIWENGQTDVAEGVTSQQYQDNIKRIQSTFASQGFSVPFFIAQSTMNVNVTDSTIRAAQAALVNGGEHRYAGPDLDTLTGGTNLQDGTHFTTTGLNNAAALWVTALDAVF